MSPDHWNSRLHFPPNIGGDCVLAAVYFTNRTPTPLLSNKTPYETLYGQPPSHSHLRVLGFLCYASIFPWGDKFAPRACACVLLGYVPTQKGYRIQDLHTQKIFVLGMFTFMRQFSFFKCYYPFINFFFTYSSSCWSSTICTCMQSTSPQPSQDPPVIHAIRHYSRVTKPLIWTQDNVCSSLPLSPHSISNYINYTRLFPTYNAFLSSISPETEPKS